MSTSPDAGTDPARPARRTATASRVRAAVLELLTTCGWPAVTHAEVASRAGVHRATVYRRWPARSDLLLEAIADAAARQVDVVPTDDPHHDLTALLRRTVDGMERSRTLIDALLGARTGSADVDAVIGRWFDRREAGFAALLDAHRGVLPGVPDAVPHAFALGMGAAWGHVLRRRTPASFDADAVARTLLDALSTLDLGEEPGPAKEV
ncbi:MAG: TetR/AcrR family transcriptional regulator [Actinomycetaceae bacterium]